MFGHYVNHLHGSYLSGNSKSPQHFIQESMLSSNRAKDAAYTASLGPNVDMCQLEPSGHSADALGNSRLGLAGFFGVEFISSAAQLRWWHE
jgi:hypothetical protein